MDISTGEGKKMWPPASCSNLILHLISAWFSHVMLVFQNLIFKIQIRLNWVDKWKRNSECTKKFEYLQK